MYFVENVIPTLNQYLADGDSIALVTLVSVDGSSPRPLGSQIGVSENGRSVGMITGGCAEKAIVEEALQCLKSKQNKTMRFGAGSPYFDIVLPCGTGIELYVEVRSCKEIVEEVFSRQAKRQTTTLLINLDTLISTVSSNLNQRDNEGIFTRVYRPDYRVFAFGEGANLFAFSSIAKAAGLTVEAFSPDLDVLSELETVGVAGRQVHQSFDFASLPFDVETAVVTLFHDHDWEMNILTAALNSEVSYIGALGSRKTHQQRLEKLSQNRSTQRSPEIIRGPVGLDIGAQDPNEITVSIIAEIIETRRKTIT